MKLQIFERATAAMLKKQPVPDVIIDALFGTGFSGAVRGEYEGMIKWTNETRTKVVAVDIPSGVNADNGKVENIGAFARFITGTWTQGSQKGTFKVTRN